MVGDAVSVAHLLTSEARTQTKEVLVLSVLCAYTYCLPEVHRSQSLVKQKHICLSTQHMTFPSTYSHHHAPLCTHSPTPFVSVFPALFICSSPPSPPRSLFHTSRLTLHKSRRSQPASQTRMWTAAKATVLIRTSRFYQRSWAAFQLTRSLMALSEQ